MAGKPTKRAPKKSRADWAPRFLERLCLNGNITAACEGTNINRGAYYHRRDTDPLFAEAVKDACEVAADRLEAEAWRRGHDGIDKPVFGSGGPGVGTIEIARVREYSDTLLIFLLKANRPEKFRERFEFKHGGSIGVEIIEPIVRTREEAKAILSALSKAS